MKTVDDALIELFTEELPPKSVLKLAMHLNEAIRDQLKKLNLSFKDTIYYATPRRLAVLIEDLVFSQEGQMIERKGPALSAAFDVQGTPTPACIGFARSCGVTPEQLNKIETSQGSYVSYTQLVTGKNVNELLPDMLALVVNNLPMAKRMRWGSGTAEFIRPVRSVVLLFGEDIVPATILGCEAGRQTYGHRFHSSVPISIPHPKQYEALLGDHFVIANFIRRRELIEELTLSHVKEQIGVQAQPQMSSELLNEVTGLVEWPVALVGKFEKEFLLIPEEVLVSAMQVHQRYFPIKEAGTLLPYFVTISNLQSQVPQQVIHGNERVLRARLSDAAFFFNEDKKFKLHDRIERLKNIVYHAKLGSIFDKSTRVSNLAAYLAGHLKENIELAREAGLLSKTDLTTAMVGEFPELQGVMGYHYAKSEGLPDGVALALKNQYLPRFAGDVLPYESLGQCLALADRLDTLVGLFGIKQIPTGDKDPYGLRRAAVGVIRILIEGKLDIDLKIVLQTAVSHYGDLFDHTNTVSEVFKFISDRLKAWYLEKGVSSDVIQAVLSIGISDLCNIDARISAVQIFKHSSEAEALSRANKRVCNILDKLEDKAVISRIDVSLLEDAAEKVLAEELEKKRHIIDNLAQQKKYDQVLLALSELRQPVDAFFDEVMVMTDDKPRRQNRILLLTQLRALFLQVADIALLQ